MNININRKTMLKILPIFLILLAIISFASYAYYKINLQGVKEHLIQKDQISFTYEEQEEQLNLTGLNLMSDEDGISQSNYFQFSVSTELSQDMTTEYEISISQILVENNFAKDDVKLYLTSVINNEETQLVGPVIINDLTDNSRITEAKTVYKSDFTYTEANVLQRHTYRLRVWIKDDLDISSYVNNTTLGNEQNFSIDNYAFKFKVNVNTADFKYSEEFLYTGNYQEWVVPKTGYYQIELWGAQGSGTYGGQGGYTSGNIYMSVGEKLYVYVGERNNTFNGGGIGYQTTMNGGGATDVRYFGNTIPSDFSWNNENGLKSRIMVAAGGAGAVNSPYIGYGGGLIGSTGYASSYPAYSGTGGSQVAGGIVTNYGCGYPAGTNGSFGQGGKGGGADGSTGSYGGGGGYYGGAGGSNLCSGSFQGGGGSSFISGYQGCVAIKEDSISPRLNGATNPVTCTEQSATTDIVCSYHYSGKIFTETQMKSGKETMPNHDGTGTITGNSGSGYAKITYIRANP